MKILHIIPNLGSGGAERFVVDLLNQLSEDQEVHLCTLYHLNEEVNSFFLPILSSRVKRHSVGKKPGLDPKMFPRIINLIRTIKPDLVHTHLSSINYILLAPFLFPRLKFFHTIHSDAQYEVKNIMELFTRKYMYKKRKIIPVTISKESSASFRKLYGFIKDHTIPNGVSKIIPSKEFLEVKAELDLYRKTPQTKLLIHIGRFVPEKNQVMLASVVKELVEDGQDIALAVIGSWNYPGGQEIREKIAALKCNRIFLLGTKKNVGDYLLSADAFCLASLYEGLPITLIEAFSAGCIPICTAVGGVPNLICNESHGFLADCNYSSIKRAIEKFLISNNSEQLKQNIINEYENKYSIQRAAHSYLSFYQSVAR